jgi:hypothetical protein
MRLSLSSLAYRLFTKRIPLDELRERLGSPRAILCVGSGPSSRHPDLASNGCDCVFRTNPDSGCWLEDGLRPPDLVAMACSPENIVAIRKGLEEGLLPRQPLILVRGRREMSRARRLGLRMDGVLDADFIDLWLNRPRHRFLSPVRRRPYTATNGALIVALAASLKPERLIVAGIDLYSHPEGDYILSGRKMVLDVWNQLGVHGMLQEAYVLFRALSGFEGGLVVLGEPLRTLLHHPRSRGLLFADAAGKQRLERAFPPGLTVERLLETLP